MATPAVHKAIVGHFGSWFVRRSALLITDL